MPAAQLDIRLQIKTIAFLQASLWLIEFIQFSHEIPAPIGPQIAAFPIRSNCATE
jgi:hypothetical protein